MAARKSPSPLTRAAVIHPAKDIKNVTVTPVGAVPNGAGGNPFQDEATELLASGLCDFTPFAETGFRREVGIDTTSTKFLNKTFSATRSKAGEVLASTQAAEPADHLNLFQSDALNIPEPSPLDPIEDESIVLDDDEQGVGPTAESYSLRETSYSLQETTLPLQSAALGLLLRCKYLNQVAFGSYKRHLLRRGLRGLTIVWKESKVPFKVKKGLFLLEDQQEVLKTFAYQEEPDQSPLGRLVEVDEDEHEDEEDFAKNESEHPPFDGTTSNPAATSSSSSPNPQKTMNLYKNQTSKVDPRSPQAGGVSLTSSKESTTTGGPSTATSSKVTSSCTSEGFNEDTKMVTSKINCVQEADHVEAPDHLRPLLNEKQHILLRKAWLRWRSERCRSESYSLGDEEGSGDIRERPGEDKARATSLTSSAVPAFLATETTTSDTSEPSSNILFLSGAATQPPYPESCLVLGDALNQLRQELTESRKAVEEEALQLIVSLSSARSATKNGNHRVHEYQDEHDEIQYMLNKIRNRGRGKKVVQQLEVLDQHDDGRFDDSTSAEITAGSTVSAATTAGTISTSTKQARNVYRSTTKNNYTTFSGKQSAVHALALLEDTQQMLSDFRSRTAVSARRSSLEEEAEVQKFRTIHPRSALFVREEEKKGERFALDEEISISKEKDNSHIRNLRVGKVSSLKDFYFLPEGEGQGRRLRAQTEPIQASAQTFQRHAAFAEGQDEVGDEEQDGRELVEVEAYGDEFLEAQGDRGSNLLQHNRTRTPEITSASLSKGGRSYTSEAGVVEVGRRVVHDTKTSLHFTSHSHAHYINPIKSPRSPSISTGLNRDLRGPEVALMSPDDSSSEGVGTLTTGLSYHEQRRLLLI
ncbi:unnamed protein product [Amoebophrya sp. A25]|nr:unnamed protein product [Amoebophrya sp. A25]|eukprot:GSA25T00022230001.1